jgi:hypothetical protein
VTRWDILTIVAGLLLAGGACCIYWPAGLIVLGLEGLVLGLLMDRRMNG